MSIQVRKATFSDIPAIIDTYFDAFHNHPVTRRIFSPRSEQVEKYWQESIDADLRDSSTHFVLVTDSASADPERVLAFGKWRDLHTSISPPSLPMPDWPKGADIAFVDEFFGTVDKKHKEIMKDRPHWYLDILGVRREYQGKGAGSRLVQWGLAKTDEAGVEAFLAASPAGAPMYAKYGFEIVETIPVDEGTRLESFMLRPAKKP
ncbi:acyl-CoA N-acyltransferase [Jackrogersella minutella]|nr:acyl-CoA N-acyltransferase [Jackrogersella minutella]